MFGPPSIACKHEEGGWGWGWGMSSAALFNLHGHPSLTRLYSWLIARMAGVVVNKAKLSADKGRKHLLSSYSAHLHDQDLPLQLVVAHRRLQLLDDHSAVLLVNGVAKVCIAICALHMPCWECGAVQ